jgi:hypothetical protein
VRAIADSMPLLELVGHTELVIVANERGKHDIAGANMGRHLARHKLDLEVKRITRGTMDVANALLSHAADNGADFIVMGGYGHSRLRGFVLGGVTQSMLHSMTLPVLIDVALRAMAKFAMDLLVLDSADTKWLGCLLLMEPLRSKRVFPVHTFANFKLQR